MEDRDPQLESGAEARPTKAPGLALRFEKFTSFVDEYASWLSLGGMFVATSDLRPVGDIVDLVIELTDGFRLIEAVGEVVWLRPRAAGAGRPAGIGVRFQALDEKGRELILKILEEQVRSGGAPFEVGEVPDDAISTPGAALDESAAPVSDDQDPEPRALEFDAPWGKELPAIPDEILDDTDVASEIAKSGPVPDEPQPSAPKPQPPVAELQLPESEPLPPDEAPADEAKPSEQEPELPQPEPTASEPVTDSAFRLAAEAAMEIESLPELAAAEAPADVDDEDQLALDLAREEEPVRPLNPDAELRGESEPELANAAVESAEPSQFGEPSEVASDQLPEPEDDVVEPTAPIVEPAAPVFEPIAPRMEPAAPVEPAAPSPTPAVPIASGAVLDYEHELDSDGPEREPRGSGSSVGPRVWIAGLVLLLLAGGGGWWLWGRSAAPTVGSSPPQAEMPGDAAGLSNTPEIVDTQLPDASSTSSAAGLEATADSAAMPGEQPATGDEAKALATAPEPLPGVEAKPASAGPEAAAGEPERVPDRSQPSRLAQRAATVRDISWQRDARGTWVSITFDGEIDPRRVRHDRLVWSREKEQLSLLGIELPYRPATVTVDSAELHRIRSGLHGTASAAELRLVFDLTASASGLEPPQVNGNRLRVLVRSSSP